MSKPRKMGRPKRGKPTKKSTINSLESLLPSDQDLNSREDQWLHIFKKYQHSDNEEISDIEIDKLSDIYEDNDNDEVCSSDESVKSEEFVKEEIAGSPVEELDMNRAQKQLQLCVQERKDNWASNGFKDNQLAIREANTNSPDPSWLFQRLVPDISMSSFHKSSSTSMVTEKKEMSKTLSKNQTIKQQVELTETITTIVKKFTVHSSHSSSSHITSAVHALTNSPLSDDVFTPVRHRKNKPAAKQHPHSEVSSNCAHPVEVNFQLPRRNNCSSDHPLYRKTPFKQSIKSCLKTSETAEDKLKSQKPMATRLKPSHNDLSSQTQKGDSKIQYKRARQNYRNDREQNSPTSSDEDDDINANWKKCTLKKSNAKVPPETEQIIIDLTIDMDDITIKSEREDSYTDKDSMAVKRKPKSKEEDSQSAPKNYSSQKHPKSSKENRKPKNSALDKQPIVKAPEYNPKANMFNPRVVLKRIDVSEYQQTSATGLSVRHKKANNQELPTHIRNHERAISSEVEIQPKSSKTKHKTHREKIETPTTEIPRRASQLAMPPPQVLPKKMKSKPSKQIVSDPAIHTKPLYSDVTKGNVQRSDPNVSMSVPVPIASHKSKSPSSTSHSNFDKEIPTTSRRIAPPSEFNSNNTINNFSADDHNFHLQLHSTANNSTTSHDDLTVQNPKQNMSTTSSMLNTTTDASLTHSTIIFSPIKNSTAREDVDASQYRISANELAQRQKLTSLEQMRIFGKPDAKAELVIPANAMYTLVRRVGSQATPAVPANGKKPNKPRRRIISSDSDSDDTDILDLMRGIVIEKRILKEA